MEFHHHLRVELRAKFGSLVRAKPFHAFGISPDATFGSHLRPIPNKWKHAKPLGTPACPICSLWQNRRALHTARTRISRRLEDSLDLSSPLETDSDILGMENPSVIPSNACGHLGCGVRWEPETCGQGSCDYFAWLAD